MANFQIESYTVRVGRTTTVPSARVLLSSPVMSHGITNTALLFYSPTYSELSGAVINVGGLNFDGITVFGLIPFEDFDRHYHVLQTEAPLSLDYSYGSSESTTKPLNSVFIRSGLEVPGEGLEDIDALAEGDIDALIGQF